MAASEMMVENLPNYEKITIQLSDLDVMETISQNMDINGTINGERV